MAGKLDGKRVAILAADMFERVELEEPRKALEEAGATIEVISIHDGEIQGLDHFDPAHSRRGGGGDPAAGLRRVVVPGGRRNPGPGPGGGDGKSTRLKECRSRWSPYH